MSPTLTVRSSLFCKSSASLDAPVASSTKSSDIPSTDADNIIEEETFYQILELDEEESGHEFSAGMALAYFSQARQTFTEMDEALCVSSLYLSHPCR